MLAARIADPKRTSREQLEEWLAAASNYVIIDALSALAARTPAAEALARDWIERRSEYPAAAGWNVLAILATEGRIDPLLARRLLRRIHKAIQVAPNRTRHSMNNALIAIGGSLPESRELALEVAKPLVASRSITARQVARRPTRRPTSSGWQRALPNAPG